MRKHCKRIVYLALALALLVSMAACGTGVTDIMEDGANRFANGKDEENYSLKNSGALLEFLIDEFSGSYKIPDNFKMDDDEYDKAKKRADGEDPADPSLSTDPSGETNPSDATDPSGSTDPTEDTQPEDTLTEVDSWDDFLRVFHRAYSDTADSVQFKVVNGYTLDLYVDLEECFRELQREDPIFVSCVASWRWGTRGDEYLVEITYTMDPDELIALKDATEALVDEAVANINVTGMTDYEIVFAVNEYLCDTVYYPPDEPYAAVTHTAYGAFENGVAVCEGYACAAKLMLNELGILCDIQVGTCTNGGGHAWNLVNLDGQWYQMDVTWNDQSASRQDYLLVTDDYMLKSRTWDFSDYPACASEPYTP